MSRRPILDQRLIDRTLGRRSKLTEADVQRTCTDLLKMDDWRSLKMEPVHDRWRKRGQQGFGELGMADSLYIRYGWTKPLIEGDILGTLLAEVMWIEWKRPLPSRLGPKATKPQLNQVNWHARERSRGALTLIAGIDFPATTDGFREWYAASGLARRVR